MEHVKMKSKTIVCGYNAQFDAEMDKLSFVGWKVLSATCNSHSDDTLVERCIETYQAILQRPVDYVEARIVHLDREIMFAKSKIDSFEKKDFASELEGLTDDDITILKSDIKAYEAEITLLREES